MAKFELYKEDFDKLGSAISNFAGNAEKEINYVLHNEAPDILIKSIKDYMPVSDRKKRHAKHSKSLTSARGNLAVTIKNTASYGYLYFPNDGQNVRNPRRLEAGNQQFLEKGVGYKKDEIIERCIGRMTDAFGE